MIESHVSEIYACVKESYRICSPPNARVTPSSASRSACSIDTSRLSSCTTTARLHIGSPQSATRTLRPQSERPGDLGGLLPAAPPAVFRAR